MFENALQKDGQLFIKTKKISAKRPSEYWLMFIKRFVLSYKKPLFHKRYLILAIPLVLLSIMLLCNADIDDIFPVLFVSLIFCVFIVIFLSVKANQAFVPVEEFHDLAKFIISIKGDIHKNLINLRLNSGVIEDKLSRLDPHKIGLKKAKGVRYDPYELERFKAVFHFKDTSICTISLHQVALRVTTTKRRSSGKTKTKMKRKHKYFHMLTLKLNASQYKVIDQKFLPTDTTYGLEVRTKTEAGFHYVKVKSKQKLLEISSTIKKIETHNDSIFTEMMQHLEHSKIVTAKASQNLIQ